MLDLNRIHLFVEIVKAGSFAGAARRLGIPTNTVSRHIQQLEAAMNMRLMHRSTRKLTLTAAGQAFYKQCAPSVEELSNAAKEMMDGNQIPSGVIRAAAPAGFFDIFGVNHIAEFLSIHPRVRVEFVLDDAKTDLIAESIDVAFRSGRLLELQSIGSKLIQTRSILVASPSYLADRGFPANPQALTEHECLPLARGSGRVNWQLDGPAGLTEVTVSGRFRANTARAVMQAAVAGLGVALLPYPLSAPEIEAGHLVRVLPQYRQEGASLYAVILNRRQVSRAVAVFVDFVAEKLRLDGAPWNEG